jgi:hypothetical protein
MLQIDGKNYEPGELPTILFGQVKPLAYVLNPKSACTLALNFVFYVNHGYRYFDPIQIHYSRTALFQIKSPEFDPRAIFVFRGLKPKSFSIVRDPLQRFVSGFLSKVFSDDDLVYRPYRDTLTSLHGIDLSPEADPARSCLAFARWLAGQADSSKIDVHFRPQVLNLQLGHRFTIDTILRLEDRAGLVAFFSQWIGVEKAEWFLSLRFNEHVKQKKDGIVTDELQQLVRRIYARDYELFYDDAKKIAS